MAVNFSPESEDDRPEPPERGSNQRILLLVLVLLVAVFGYLYFFTGLIRPMAEAPKPPPVQTAQVKKPLPPRPEQGGEKQEQAAKPEAKPPAPATVEKTAPQPAPAAAKPAAVPSAKPPAAPTQQAPDKAVKAEEKPLQKEQAKAPPAPAPAVKPREKAAAKTAGKTGAYTLLVGEFAAGQELNSLQAKLKKAGFTPIHRKKVTKLELMHRLFLAEFDTYDAAHAELRRLRQTTDNAFLLPENGKFRVYAGSYLHEGGAAHEQARLAGKGVKLSMKSAKVMIPKVKVTAGAFSTRKDAQKGVDRLKKQGLDASVLKAG